MEGGGQEGAEEADKELQHATGAADWRQQQGRKRRRRTLRQRARGRGWIPMTGQRKRGHPDQEQDQADTIERPPKRGNRGRGRPPGRIATGANRVPLSLSQPQAQQEVSIRMGAEEEEVESQETDMDQLSQDQVVVEEEEEEGLRLGEL